MYVEYERREVTSMTLDQLEELIIISNTKVRKSFRGADFGRKSRYSRYVV